MRLAIVCSGQAAQSRAMLDAVLGHPACAEVRKIASEMKGQDVGVWWRGLSDHEMFRNEHAQFAIVVYQLCRWAQWQQWAAHAQATARGWPAPTLTLGYSLGELVSAHVAGALGVQETLHLAVQRAACMDQASVALNAGPQCLLVWRGTLTEQRRAQREQAMRECGVQVVIYRRPGEEVLAGTTQALDRFLQQPGMFSEDHVRLGVSVPSHSSALAAATQAFHEVLQHSPLKAPTLTFLSGIQGVRCFTRQHMLEALSQQISTPLNWYGCMQALVEYGVNTVVELGPGNDLSRLISSTHPALQARSLEELKDEVGVAHWWQTQMRNTTA